MNSTTDNNTTECAHCGKEALYELDCGGLDPCCILCWTHYARPREEGESWEDYSTRLPFTVEGEEREITKKEIKERFDPLFEKALLSTPDEDRCILCERTLKDTTPSVLVEKEDEEGLLCMECWAFRKGEWEEEWEEEEKEGRCGRCGEDNGKGGTELWNDLCSSCDDAEWVNDDEVEGQCVYCKKDATYECDRCKKSEGSDGGKMCEGCYYEKGVALGEEILCGGCYWEHQNEPCRLEKS